MSQVKKGPKATDSSIFQKAEFKQNLVELSRPNCIMTISHIPLYQNLESFRKSANTIST
jgi:hypothetical protein